MYMVPSGVYLLLPGRFWSSVFSPLFPQCKRVHIFYKTFSRLPFLKQYRLDTKKKFKKSTNQLKTIIDLRMDKKLKHLHIQYWSNDCCFLDPALSFMPFIMGNSKHIDVSARNRLKTGRLKRVIFCRPTPYSVTGYRVPCITIRRADVLNLERTLSGGKIT